ncbi:Uncharacterised protein [Mycobacteroides abscessus subsp. massiliense]|nr:Uncharacterised protein [Mycobacteroides abscessus subsp. massiliense]
MKSEKIAGLRVVREEQTTRIEPRFGKPGGQIVLTPASLLRMPGECGIVDPQNIRIILGPSIMADYDTRIGGDGRQICQRSAHLV